MRQAAGPNASATLARSVQIVKVDAEQLQQEITERTTPLVIDFYATWCGPCLLLAKELEKVGCRKQMTQYYLRPFPTNAQNAIFESQRLLHSH